MIAMGLLHTIETMLNVMEDVPGLCTVMEPVVLQVIGYIFENSVMGRLLHLFCSRPLNFNYSLIEFYEETLLLVYELTKKTISIEMWQVLGVLYTVSLLFKFWLLSFCYDICWNRFSLVTALTISPR